MAKRHIPKDLECRKTTLRNGLRVVTQTIPSVRSVSIGIWIDVGSRNESAKDNGLSHFVEHMVFKGTDKRSSREIADSLESIGGALNGFTSREHTCYTARILDEHLDIAMDVLADISCHPKMTAPNMKKERLVICEEIKESLDTPADHIHDLFSETFWDGHPLGQPIMGSESNMMAVTRKQLKSFQEKHYRYPNIVVAASGSVSHAKLVKIVREKFDFGEGQSEEYLPPVPIKTRRSKFQETKNAQTHLCIGFPSIGFNDGGRGPIILLNSFLGGGMSSVLFQKIREERGLAYSVWTYHDFHRDCGIFGAYVGTDGTKVALAYDVILKEMLKMKRRKVSDIQLDKIKAQLKGQITLSLESTGARMNRMARQELLIGKFQTLEDIFKMIDGVTPTDVLNIANRVINEDNIAIAMLGQADKTFIDEKFS